MKEVILYMKFLKSYCVVDVDAENIISNFLALNSKMAKRLFDEAYKSVPDDIKDRYAIYEHSNCISMVAESVEDLQHYVLVFGSKDLEEEG